MSLGLPVDLLTRLATRRALSRSVVEVLLLLMTCKLMVVVTFLCMSVARQNTRQQTKDPDSIFLLCYYMLRTIPYVIKLLLKPLLGR